MGERDAEDAPAATTISEFRASLRTLLRDAADNGVDVRGSWPVENADGTDEWDVEITAVTRRTETTLEAGGVPAAAIVEAVAEREGVPVTDLPPLYEAIAPTVFEDLLGHDGNGADQAVRFEYLGYRVTVTADGRVEITA